MRLADFLIFLLDAHADTLRRLAALMGEETLLEVLEDAGERPEQEPPSLLAHRDPSFFTQPSKPSGGAPYAELESTVREFNLAPTLEFHLWAYPLYRVYIESDLDLNALIPSSGETTAILLADEAVQEAKRWIHRLPLSPETGGRAESAAQVPWVRFRAAVLKKIGQRPLGPVY